MPGSSREILNASVSLRATKSNISLSFIITARGYTFWNASNITAGTTVQIHAGHHLSHTLKRGQMLARTQTRARANVNTLTRTERERERGAASRQRGPGIRTRDLSFRASRSPGGPSFAYANSGIRSRHVTPSSGSLSLCLYLATLLRPLTP